jgi:alpha-tubulin suppressor-like RCC1 family protein
MAAGVQHSVAVDPHGQVWAWGSNLFGELAQGAGNFQSFFPSLPQPTVFPPSSRVAAGIAHTAALGATGEVWCCGSNQWAQLGDPGLPTIVTGGTFNFAQPVQAVGVTAAGSHPAGGAKRALALTAGWFHTLAIQNGDVWAWGRNDAGQLGRGTVTTSSASPQPTNAFADAIEVAAGYGHSLALLENGRVFAWGSNLFGEVGNGGNASPVLVPSPVKLAAPAVAVYAASSGSAALLDNGELWAWGWGWTGGLGIGTPTTLLQTVPAKVLDDVSSAALGGQHGLAVTSGEIRSWGENTHLEVGDGTNQPSFSPVPIWSPLPTGKFEVAAGLYHSFAYPSR